MKDKVNPLGKLTLLSTFMAEAKARGQHRIKIPCISINIISP